MPRKALYIILFLLVWVGSQYHLIAQEIEPVGAFQADSIKIGIPVIYSLAVKYPNDMDVVFPDSLYDFAPFELEKKAFFPTQSDATHSYDSATYELTSFEIDKVQHLSLPIYIVGKQDSTSVYAKRDSVLLVELIPVVPDSLKLKENAAYIHVPTQFNYPYLVIALSVLALILVGVWIFFGSKIKMALILRRMKRTHAKFLEQFDNMVRDNNNRQTEQILMTWKQYLEKLMRTPYTKLTTREIVSIKQNRDIENTLRLIDRSIYGSTSEHILDKSFHELRKFSNKKYQQKVNQIKNG